ncbi:MAG: sulfite exporter TauE/SafE family protein [Chitinophagaceae bacterium]|nr:sulfite exporter TauE/SafE family protein [Chitinophagaceae bacterium]
MMLWPVMISGFTLGAAGSLHCIGMCGPLSLALPVHQFSAIKKFASLLLYQFGRIITYSSIGLLFGLAGRRIYLAGYQQSFSIAMGIFILLLAALYFIRHRNIHIKGLDKIYAVVQKLIGRVLRSRGGAFSFLLLGMANGLLPCGMVYIALATTLSFNEISHSVGFMAMFGAGTLPAMMLVGYAGTMISFRQRMKLRKLVPVFISIMGVILILRGLDLGIPFISPSLPHSPGQTIECHQ